MDQLTAHLDRGWDLAQKGDTRGAESSARRAIELCPESPEAHNLLGYVASLDGDCEEAVEAYLQAIVLDDTYVEAMLNAAELYVHPMGEFERALELCDRVLDISDYDDEVLDALLLKFEAYWAKGDDEDAKAVLARLPKGPYETAMHNFLAGRAHYEAGDAAKAKPLLDAALAADPNHADACYYAGLIAEQEGDLRQACQQFLRVRQLELGAGLPAWAPNEHSFLGFVERAVRELPPAMAELMQQAEVFVVDLPGPEMIVDGVDVRAMALVDVLAARPDANGSDAALRVFLYAVNVLRTAGGLHACQGVIQDALERELEVALEELRGNGPAN